MDLLVGMKEMAQIAKQEKMNTPENIKNEPQQSETVDISKPDLDKDSRSQSAFDKDSRSQSAFDKDSRSQSAFDNIFITNDEEIIPKKPKGKPRGVSQKTPDELAQHLAKMREKAAIVKREKAEERKKKISELNDIKLSKKLDIPVETLVEYENIRKQEVAKKQTNNSDSNTATPRVEKNAVVAQLPDLDAIVNKLFDRINSARQAQEQAKLLKEKEDADALLIKQKIDNENMLKQKQIQQRNQQYFSSLGNGKTPISVKQNSDWMSLFNRKK